MALLGVLEPVTAYRINRNYRRSNVSFRGQRQFYRQFGKMPLVFDVGANKGNKTDIFYSLGSKVVVVEPDDQNHQILVSRFRFHKKVAIEKLALSEHPGQKPFYVLDAGQELNTMSEKWKDAIEHPLDHRFPFARTFKDKITVQTATLDMLIEKYGMPDYIKIDVEGHESEVLKGLSHPVSLLSFESNLPEFLYETMTGIDSLHSLDQTLKFNIAKNCHFIFSKWMDAETTKEKLKQISSRTVEIFCRNN